MSPAPGANTDPDSDDTSILLDDSKRAPRGRTRPPPPPPAAAWAATISGCSSKSTSIALSPDGSLMAVSCWDGSAFAFRGLRRDPSQGGGGNASSCFGEWEQIVSVPDGEDEAPSWQKATNAPADGVFPTFAAVHRPPIEDERGLRNALMAVSTPNSGNVRCFDLDAGTGLGILNDASDGGTAGGGEGADATIKCVQGMLSFGGSLLWVDGSDAVRCFSWPDVDNTNKLEDPLFLPPWEMSVLAATARTKVVEREDSHGGGDVREKGAEERRHEARLVRPPSDPTWTLRCTWDKGSKEQEVLADLSLPFLDGESAADMIRRARQHVHRRRHGKVVNESDQSLATSRVMIDREHAALYIAGLDMAFTYDRRERRWSELDLSGSTVDEETANGGGGTVRPSKAVALVPAHFLAEITLVVGSKQPSSSNDDYDEQGTCEVGFRFWNLGDRDGIAEPHLTATTTVVLPPAALIVEQGEDVDTEQFGLCGEVQSCPVATRGGYVLLCAVVSGRWRGCILLCSEEESGPLESSGRATSGSSAADVDPHRGIAARFLDLAPFLANGVAEDDAIVVEASLTTVPDAAERDKNMLVVRMRIGGVEWNYFPSIDMWSPV
mmetsp:Transcript_25439/g.74910  ORF Transcript_25439/g.74910 Transcript_25439/m.74910 type:complete len:609 (+) Transcript_25439:1223-3049(+)